MEKSTWIVLWEATPVQRHGKVSRTPESAYSHGKDVTESVMETARCAASWKGVIESDTDEA